MEEKEISIKLIFWKVLLSWRSLIVCGILFAILLSGLFVLKDYKSYKDTPSEEEETTEEEIDLDEIKEDMTETEYKDANSLAYLYGEKYELEKIMQDSYIMQMSLSNARYASVKYYIMEVEGKAVVDTDYTQDTLLIEKEKAASFFTNNFFDDDFMDGFEKCCDAELTYEDIKNLIWISAQGSNVTVQYVYNSLEADADAINELIKDRLEEMSDEYQAYIEHELIYMSEFDTECPYDKLNNVKTSYSNTLYDIQSKIWTLEGKLSDEQILLAEDIAIGEEQKAEEKTADRDKDEIEEDANADAFALTLHKKYIVIGAVVGILLMAVFIVVRECISVKLASADELSDYFMLPVIGSFEKPEGKKRFLHVVDDWLISLKERHHKKLTYEQQLENIVTAIGVRCEQEGIGELCMTGTCLLDIDKTMTDDIGQQLKKCYDIKTVFVDNISYNAEALKVCSEIGNAVILEIVGTSIEDEIERQLLMLKEYNVNVLGAIAV